jgi:hypothetical protein
MIETVIDIDKSKLLGDLEQRIESAENAIYGCLCEIRDKKLWEGQYASWERYLAVKHNISSAKYSQMRANYNAMETLDYDIGELNPYAIRELRKTSEDLRQAVLSKAIEKAKADGRDKWSSSDIKDVCQPVIDALLTGGYVDCGDGEMTGMNAAIHTQEQERIMRQRQHRNGGVVWNTSLITGDGYSLIDEILPEAFAMMSQTGKQVSIKWAIIESEGE